MLCPLYPILYPPIAFFTLSPNQSNHILFYISASLPDDLGLQSQQYMAFEARSSRDSLDRKLTILKSKVNLSNIGSKQQKRYFGKRHSEEHTLQEIFSERNGSHEWRKDKAADLFLNRRSGFVRLFISQLKKNASNIRSDHMVAPSPMTRYIDQMYNVSYDEAGSGIKGIKSREKTELAIAVLTVVAINVLHFLSTFQCLFDDYRHEHSRLPALRALKYACLIFTVIKIGSSFLLTTVVLGKRIEFISQIAYHYVTCVDFYLDLLVLVSAILLLSLPGSEYAGMFVFCVTIMNVVYIQRLEEAVDVYFITSSVKKQVFELLKLLLGNFYVVHFMAALLVGLTLIENSQNWMDKYGIGDEVWWVKYIYSLYWSASIIATVGFGDITVRNYTQAMVMTVIILFGCLILSYNIAQVGNIINTLKRTPQEVKHQLSVLRRLAIITNIDENLHHSISEYIVHSAEIKKSFEVQERTALVANLPSQMREEFVEQSSRNFCAPLPFFFMLESETKKAVCEKLAIEVLSPNEYITHKRRGLSRICVLRKGVIGLAYKKSGSRLNGTVLDTITIKHEKDQPQLLNTYLLIRDKRLVYDIICQEYCVVACLQFSHFLDALHESQRDFQLYHQSRDEAHFRLHEWDKKMCEYCQVRHSLFVCPKMHYMPLRSQTFLKAQQRDAALLQRRPLFRYRRQKSLLATYSPRKLWKKLFVHVEDVFETRVQKNQLLRMRRTDTDEKDEWEGRTTRQLVELYFQRNNEKMYEFSLDILKDYAFYFSKNNPSKLAEITLKKDFLPILIERTISV